MKPRLSRVDGESKCLRCCINSMAGSRGMTRQTRNNKGTPNAMDHLRCKPVKHCNVISETQYPWAQAACDMSRARLLDRPFCMQHLRMCCSISTSIQRIAVTRGTARSTMLDKFSRHCTLHTGTSYQAGMVESAAYLRVLWVGYT